VATRLPSTLFSLAGIIVLFDLCRLLRSPRAGLLAAAIMALAIGQIEFATEARSYPMVIFLALGVADVVVRMSLSGTTRLRLAALAIGGSLLLLTHYFAAGVYAAIIVFALLRLRGVDRRRSLSVLAGVIIFVAVVWGGGVEWQIRMAPSLNPSYLRETEPHHLVQTGVRILKLPLVYVVGDTFAASVPLEGHFAASLLIFLVPSFRLRRRPDLLIWVLWTWAVVGPIALLDLIHDSTILAIPRYTVFAAPAVFALIASFDWPVRAIWRDVLPLTGIACLGMTGALWFRQPISAREDFRLLSEIVDNRAAPNELLVFYNDSGWISPGVWYVGYKYYSPDSRHPWMTLHRRADQNALEQLHNYKLLWLIGRQPEIDGPAVLPGWRPQEVWPTSAGRICLMTRVSTSP
jgi:hypothetical protein